MKTNYETNQVRLSGNPKLNFNFIQKVINVGFLILMIGVLTSFFSKPEEITSALDGTAKELAVDPYVGEIALFAFNFAPQGWARCEGQILQISQNTALFALIGTTYGGNGQNTFGLPDLRGRVPIGSGTGPGLPTYIYGQKAGNTNTSLSVANLPPHNHSASGTVSYPAKNGGGDETNPGGGYVSTATTDFYAETPNTNLGPASVNVTVNNTGNGTSFTNMQPYLTMGYYIALEGVFPSQN